MTISLADIQETTQESAATLICDGYKAFAAGDVPTVLAMLAEDVSWHICGRRPLTGVYRGRVWRVQDGLATRFQAFMDDEYAVDEFWSS
jgi:ketosteroid isomerase-like protein